MSQTVVNLILSLYQALVFFFARVCYVLKFSLWSDYLAEPFQQEKRQKPC